MSHPTSRRTFLASGTALGLGLLLGGCGDDDDTGAGKAPATESGAYPVTLRHRFGTTTISEPPRRVVASGFNDSDYVLAAGVTPVAIADFFGEFDEDGRSWIRGRQRGAKPPVVSDDEGTLQIEKVAAARPDLIVHYNYLDETIYRRLKEIAPVVTEPTEGERWPRHTTDVFKALGKPAEGRRLVQRVQKVFADARRAHPELEGKTAAVYFDVGGKSQYFLLEADDARIGLFTSLGLKPPAKTGEVSRERADLLDQDLLIVVGKTPQDMAGDEVFQRLSAVREGRVAYLGDFASEFAGALGFDSPLSLPRAVELAVPKLSKAAKA